jgi:hypothetical protein
MFNMFNTMPSHNTEPGRRCYTDARADNGALATRRQCGPDLRRSRDGAGGEFRRPLGGVRWRRAIRVTENMEYRRE